MTMMIGRNGGRLAAAAGQRLFIAASLRGVSSGAAAPLMTQLSAGPARGVTASWIWAPAIGLRNESTIALDQKAAQPRSHEEKAAGSAGAGGEEKGIVSYWGISPSKVTKEDGTEWKWKSFRVLRSFLPLFPFPHPSLQLIC